MSLTNIFILLSLAFSIGFAHADLMQPSLQKKGDASLFSKSKVIISKGDDYKQIRKKLISLGWKSYRNPYIDKPTPEVYNAININKLLGSYELQQCFNRGKNLYSCDVTWTNSGNRENPELFFGILIDTESQNAFIEEDTKSN